MERVDTHPPNEQEEWREPGTCAQESPRLRSARQTTLREGEVHEIPFGRRG